MFVSEQSQPPARAKGPEVTCYANIMLSCVLRLVDIFSMMITLIPLFYVHRLLLWMNIFKVYKILKIACEIF